MKRFDLRTLGLTLAASLLVWVAAAAVGVLVGSTGIVGAPTLDQFNIRLSTNVFPASMIGAALAMAGVAYQAILRNPLADPYLLGASGGAMLASYVWRLQGIASIAILGTLSPQVFALVGSLAAITIVLVGAGWRGRLDPVTAILVGVVINSLCAAIFMLLNAIYRDLPGSGGMLTFLVGDIQTIASRSQMIASAIMIGAGGVLLMCMAPLLNVVRLSEDEARSLGVSVQRVRWGGLLVASIITAAAVAVSGPIGFIGLICPHVGRWFVGSDNRKLLPVAAAIGAGLLTLADVLSRYLLASEHVATLIPVGVITACIGGPFLLVILSRMKR